MRVKNANMTVTGRAGREPLGRGLAEADLRRAVGGQRGWRRGKGSRPGPEAAEAGRATWPCGPGRVLVLLQVQSGSWSWMTVAATWRTV